MRGGADEKIDPKAHALRPARIFMGGLRHYSATTFPGGPYSGCELYMRRCEAFGHVKEDGSDCWVDVLGENGDILQEIPVTVGGFNYLRRVLKFQLESADPVQRRA
jgi:hypothetical protein